MGNLLIMSKKELRCKSIFDLVKLGQITQVDASKRLYLSYRQTKRSYQRYLREESKPSKRAYSLKLKKAALALGIKVIKSYSSQEKGRVERSHGFYQDRFVKELRLKGINTIERANKLRRGKFIDNLNNKFMKELASNEDAHNTSIQRSQNARKNKSKTPWSQFNPGWFLFGKKETKVLFLVSYGATIRQTSFSEQFI